MAVGICVVCTKRFKQSLSLPKAALLCIMGRSSIKYMMEGFDSPVKEVGINPNVRILSTKLTNSSNLEVYFVSVDQSENM